MVNLWGFTHILCVCVEFTFWGTYVTDYSDIGNILVSGSLIFWYRKYGVRIWQHPVTYSLGLMFEFIWIVFFCIYWLIMGTLTLGVVCVNIFRLYLDGLHGSSCIRWLLLLHRLSHFLVMLIVWYLFRSSGSRWVPLVGPS